MSKKASHQSNQKSSNKTTEQRDLNQRDLNLEKDHHASELELVRFEKLQALETANIAPFSSAPEIKDNSLSLTRKFDHQSKQELSQQTIDTSVAGRIITVRGPFLVIKDSQGEVQIYVDKNQTTVHKVLSLLDRGDIVWFSGQVMKTNTNQIAIRAQNVQVLTKALKTIPSNWYGLKDIELRYRKRYLDLIANDQVKKTFWTRTKIIQYIRQYFDQLNYMEVETPILHEILGGAAARPFTTRHNALKMNFYLRIATELPLKKLLVGGIDRVYEIGRIFRNEGIDTTHNPEFTSIEFYEAYSNLDTMIQRTEDVITYVSQKLNLETIHYDGQDISLKPPFQKLDMVEAVGKAINQQVLNLSLQQIKTAAQKHGIKIEPYWKMGHIINALFEKLIEPTLIQPTFVTNFPIEISPLAAKNPHDPRFTQRAELFINCREYANMFTELNDPIDQLQRFKSQLKERQAGNIEANEIDHDFIEALQYGMPPAGGCGIGIDRLVMLLTNQHSIRDVLLFPHLKTNPEKND